MAELLQPVYRANGWEWSKVTEGGVPSVDDIEDTIVQLYAQVRGNKDTLSVATGRLKVTRLLDEYGNTEDFELSLTLPWWDDE